MNKSNYTEMKNGTSGSLTSTFAKKAPQSARRDEVLKKAAVENWINSGEPGTMIELRAVVDIAPGAYGYFYANTSLAWLQPRAKEWLGQFFPDEVKDAHNIPLRIVSLLRQSWEEGDTPKSFSQPSSTELLSVFLSQSPMGGWILRLERKPRTCRSYFSPLVQLTARENDVLRWMVEGKRNAEIATILGISPRTVEKHVQAILANLQVENRATAIFHAMELAAATHQNGAGI
jgi:DNA-binding CsgD family transcriptional regulator